MNYKKIGLSVLTVLLSFGIGLYINNVFANLPKEDNFTLTKINNMKDNDMKLGAFSVSLNVKDLEVSKQFYENLGFRVFGGSMEHNYLIMKNGNALIGIFQGMFEGNILTFNPGWDENAQNVESFMDVRDIQKNLKQNGVELATEADENTSGPASITLTDPDGNIILIDQHR